MDKSASETLWIVDAHQDLAWNMLTFGRDYARSVLETRRLEQDSLTVVHNDDTLLGWAEYQRGRVALIVATLFVAPERYRSGEWDFLCYRDARQANRFCRQQVDYYHRFVDQYPSQFCLVKDRKTLQAHLHAWDISLPHPKNSVDSIGEPPVNAGSVPAASPPVGLILSMEGAEAVLAPSELEEWWQSGVRLIGPAWAGTRFCGGTREPGPLTAEGRVLLDGMMAMGFGLDLSHMDEQAALQALDGYDGVVIASHSNPSGRLKGTDVNRHLTDAVLRRLIERDGVVGIVPYNAFLQVGWRRGDRRDLVSLEQFLAMIDYVCQMAGDAQHVGLGTDFDGGFGRQSVPPGLESIADLRRLIPMLAERGYSQADIAAILGKNWVERLEKVLPEHV